MLVPILAASIGMAAATDTASETMQNIRSRQIGLRSLYCKYVVALNTNLGGKAATISGVLAQNQDDFFQTVLERDSKGEETLRLEAVFRNGVSASFRRTLCKSDEWAIVERTKARMLNGFHPAELFGYDFDSVSFDWFMEQRPTSEVRDGELRLKLNMTTDIESRLEWRYDWRFSAPAGVFVSCRRVLKHESGTNTRQVSVDQVAEAEGMLLPTHASTSLLRDGKEYKGAIIATDISFTPSDDLFDLQTRLSQPGLKIYDSTSGTTVVRTNLPAGGVAAKAAADVAAAKKQAAELSETREKLKSLQAESPRADGGQPISDWSVWVFAGLGVVALAGAVAVARRQR